MRELSLFSGAGGGLLGSILLGWRTVGAVEIEEYPCEVLAARQRDGCLDDFPIWNMDIQEFNRRVAPGYRGLVDVVSAGFPCQPFSVAGQQRGADDERNMWPATIECIRVVRPRFCFLENVPGLLAGHGYFATILRDLAASGYDARWRVLSAAEVGAPHLRDRVFVMGYTKGAGFPRSTMGQGQGEPGGNGTCQSTRSSSPWWSFEPDVGRVANGVASRVDRLKAIGNGQVPIVAATAWRLLAEGLD